MKLAENILLGLALLGLAVFGINMLVPASSPYTGWGIGVAIVCGMLAMIIGRVNRIRERIKYIKNQPR